jgi:hypothetical protein
MMNVADRLRESGTDYFEAKPQRAVKLNEFSAAVVPKTVRPETLDILNRNGINNISKYDGTPEDRRAKVEKIAAKTKALFLPREANNENMIKAGDLERHGVKISKDPEKRVHIHALMLGPAVHKKMNGD